MVVRIKSEVPYKKSFVISGRNITRWFAVRKENNEMCVSVSRSKNTNWVFAEMFGQWRSVSIRYTALPRALVRGGGKSSAHWYRGEFVTHIPFTKKDKE